MRADNPARADAAVIRAAAARLRSATIMDQYRGREHPVRAFHACLLLDALGRPGVSLPDDVRRVVVDACRAIGGPMSG